MLDLINAAAAAASGQKADTVAEAK